MGCDGVLLHRPGEDQAGEPGRGSGVKLLRRVCILLVSQIPHAEGRLSIISIPAATRHEHALQFLQNVVFNGLLRAIQF
jgi:hypothetical protein